MTHESQRSQYIINLIVAVEVVKWLAEKTFDCEVLSHIPSNSEEHRDLNFVTCLYIQN